MMSEHIVGQGCHFVLSSDMFLTNYAFKKMMGTESAISKKWWGQFPSVNDDTFGIGATGEYEWKWYQPENDATMSYFVFIYR